jgi:hypothetical protein
MQEFSIAFGRVSRATFSTDPELKTHITQLVNRAYFNIHNTSLATADNQWANAISAAALQLCMDARVRELSTRELIHLFENVIRVSEEHLHEARRNAAMATNVFYLKETALDAALIEHQQPSDFTQAASTVLGMRVAHSGRLRTTKETDA